MAPGILAVGSLAYDDVRTPDASRAGLLGGGAAYFVIAASLYAPTRLSAVIGDDFREQDLERLRTRGVDLSGVDRRPGRSLHWSGAYDVARDIAVTSNTDLGVVSGWRPDLPMSYRNSDFAFLSNTDPLIQAAALEQLHDTTLVAQDTMHSWITSARDDLLSVMRRVNAVFLNRSEVDLLFGRESDGPREILALGPRIAVIKSGARGARVATPTAAWSSPSFAVDQVIDPTGAGDAFAGGFLGRLAESGSQGGATPRDALLHGSACASFAVEGFGVLGIEAATRSAVDERVRALGLRASG
jgi:sugar/nucleoside kinase (ribokinase family)